MMGSPMVVTWESPTVDSMAACSENRKVDLTGDWTEWQTVASKAVMTAEWTVCLMAGRMAELTAKHWVVC